MDFSNYYILQELSIKSDDVRFLALSDDKLDWLNKINDVIDAADASEITSNITFIISDPTGNFNLFLIYKYNTNTKEKTYSYSVKDTSVKWMEFNNITKEDESSGFFYDVEGKEFVIVRHGLVEIIVKEFPKNKLKEFLSNMFYINNLCKTRKGFSLVYSLNFYDNFSAEDAKKIRENGISPRWLLYVMKGDEYRRKEKSGLFGYFKR